MKKHKHPTVSIQIPAKIITRIDRHQTITMFQDLNKTLTTETYVFCQDLKTFEGNRAYGFSIKGHAAMFGIQNILIKLQIRGVTFIKCGHGQEQKSEIHIDPDFKGFFVNICSEMGCLYPQDKIPQIHNYLNQNTH